VGLATKLALLGLGLVVILTTLALVVVVVSMTRGQRRDGKVRSPGRFAHLDQKEMGSPAAKVRVLAILSLRTDCHEPAIGVLLDAVKAEPDRIHLRFLERRSPHGEQELAKRKLECASIVINDATRFNDVAGKDIRLEGGPDENYTTDQLRAILGRLIEAAYGAAATENAPPPPDAAGGEAGETAPKR